MLRVCLVTPSHPTSNPRLIKEADALHAAGYDVHVVAGRYFPPLDAFDAELYASVNWKRTVVDYTGGPRALLGKLNRRLSRLRLANGCEPSLSLATAAHHSAISALATAAAQTRADLYIGHCLAGLAAAGLAANRTGGQLGFDAEDFHPAETHEAETDPLEINSIRRIDEELLPRCRHLTAASPLIGQAYADRYNLKLKPVTILNVFPLVQAPATPPPVHVAGKPLRLYWFSQTIGPGRGLEALVAALGKMNSPVSLHLRGIPASGFPNALRNLARESGWRGVIEFLDYAPADQMPRLASGHDLGLSLEQSSPLNRDLCLTNKIFTYLLAGLPVALSSTTAQNKLSHELGAAGLALPLADPVACASTLDAFACDLARRHAATTTAWRLGQQRYNWDYEQRALLSALGSSIHDHR